MHLDNVSDMHCTDEAACQQAYEANLPYWVLNQFPAAQVDYQKYLIAQELQRELTARKWQTGDIYRQAGYQLTAMDEAALAMVRDMVDGRAAGYLELGERLGERLELAASVPCMADPATPEVRPEPVRFGNWDDRCVIRRTGRGRSATS